MIASGVSGKNWSDLIPKISGLIVAIAALGGILRPLSDWVKYTGEQRLKEIELEQSRENDRRTYILKVVGETPDLKDKVALIQFMKIEYPDPDLDSWYDEQIKRLQEQLSYAVQRDNEKVALLASSIEQSKRSLTPNKVTPALQEQLEKLEDAKQQRLLNEQYLAAVEKAKDTQEKECSRDKLTFQVYKPFGPDRTRADYSSEPAEVKRIIEACLDSWNRKSSIWKAQVKGPEDPLVPKLITCSC